MARARDQERRHHEGGTGGRAGGSVGSGASVDSSASVTSPLDGASARQAVRVAGRRSGAGADSLPTRTVAYRRAGGRARRAGSARRSRPSRRAVAAGVARPSASSRSRRMRRWLRTTSASPALSALGQRRCGKRLEEPRGSGHLAALLEPRGGGLVIVPRPEMRRSRHPACTATSSATRQALLEQRNRLVGLTGPARLRFGQEDRAKPIGDIEVRIQRRREIEKRVEKLEMTIALGELARAAEVLKRANPVDVGEQRRMTAPGA